MMIVTVAVLAASVLLSIAGICAYGVLAGRQAELWRGACDLVLNLRSSRSRSPEMTGCPHCGHPSEGRFCSTCGALRRPSNH